MFITASLLHSFTLTRRTAFLPFHHAHLPTGPVVRQCTFGFQSFVRIIVDVVRLWTNMTSGDRDVEQLIGVENRERQGRASGNQGAFCGCEKGFLMFLGGIDCPWSASTTSCEAGSLLWFGIKADDQLHFGWRQHCCVGHDVHWEQFVWVSQQVRGDGSRMMSFRIIFFCQSPEHDLMGGSWGRAEKGKLTDRGGKKIISGGVRIPRLKNSVHLGVM